jgi:2-haloacid dehalogenase
VNYRYLTFDCYGTLIDWKTGIEKGLRAAIGNVKLSGIELLTAYVNAEKAEESTYKKYREVLRSTAMSMSGALGVEVSDVSARNFAASVPAWPAFEDTAEFLHEMGQRGYKRYILSNVDNDLLEGTIKKNHLEVDGYVTAEEVGSYKPNERHWIEFIRRTGTNRGQVLHVANSVFHDIVPTQHLGIDSAWINRYSERLPPEASPLIISDNLERLASMLD